MFVILIILFAMFLIWASVQSNIPHYDYSTDHYLWQDPEDYVEIEPQYVDELLKVQVIPNNNAEVCNHSEIEDEMDTWI